MTSRIAVGYACLNPDLGRGFKTCRFANLTQDKWIELITWNLETLKQMIIYTADYHIGLLRLSSDIIPFATKPKEGVDLNWQAYFADTFMALRQLIAETKIRISMHPGQYTVLNSPRPDVVSRAEADLAYHAELLELLGGDQTNKIIIHIGGVYGDKEAAIERFITKANQLSQRIRRHLIIENDERLFSIDDVLVISARTQLPIVFDNLHHEVHRPEDQTPITTYIIEAAKSWQLADGRQKVHYSQQALGKRNGAHTDTIAIKPFLAYLELLPDYPIDIMLEVKDKNRSAEKIQVYLDQDIRAAEKLWAKWKYAVLAKSAHIYHQIRQVLKNKDNCDFVTFIDYLEKAEALPEDKGSEINAAGHIWGYFKNQVNDKESKQYQNYIAKLQADKITISVFRQFFKKLLKKYPNEYLSHSMYFK